MASRYRPRFFDQAGHQTTNASMGNKHFSIKSCHCQTYQNYEQSRQKLSTFLGNKVPKNSKIHNIFLIKVGLLVKYSSKNFFLEIFDHFLTLKNDFENQNFEMFEEVVHNFGKFGGEII